MPKYAVIQLAGKQFKVAEGDVIKVASHIGEADKKMTVSDVLLTGDEKTTKVGTPLVENAKVELTILDQGKAEKISVRTYRNKSRYRRHYGHRQPQTTLKVTKITA